MAAHSHRTIRLFVSSTFSDMKAERDLLQRVVFPKLKQLCLSKGLRFQAIDLRWGVSEEAGRHNRTMRICLRELARCQQGTPKPNFLVLLGDRYGWRPLPETVRADLFEQLKPWVESDGPQAAAALRWYRRDDNAVPAEYVLQPREGTVADYDAWCREVERPLLAAMERAAARLLADASLSTEERIVLETSIGLSATHQEILHGALRVEDAREHVHAFVRSIRYAPARTPHENFVDRLPNGGEDIESKRRLDGLRDKLQRHLGADNFHRYAVDWREAGSFTDDDLSQFAEDVYRALEKVVLAQIARLETIAPDVQEEQAHRDFGAERRDGFLGREEPLRRIAGYLAAEAGRPLVVFGVAGSGKSALMAKAVEEFQRSEVGGQKSEIIERYIGATPGSSDIIALLRNIVGAIRRQYPLPTPANPEQKGPRDDEIPFEMSPLSAAFRDALGRGTAEKPLILFLDALDQLSETQRAHQLHWLPATLPANVHLVVSAALPAEVRSPGFSRSGSEAQNAEPPKGGTPNQDPRASLCRALEAITHPEDRVVLDKLEPENGEKLLHRWLGLEGRTLQPAQRSAILNDFAHERNPLWLRTAAAEAARLASWQEPSHLPPDTPSLMRHVLHRLSAEENHGAMLVDRALSYLACARHGLAEDELLDILSQDEDVMAGVIRRSPTERVKPEVDQIKALPAAVWVALRGDIARCIGEHEAQGAMLMRFYHRSFREAVEVEFLLERTDRRDRHTHLASVFSRHPWTLPSTPGAEATLSDPPDARKTSELPWHLFQSAENSDPDHQRPEVWDPVAATLCDMCFVEAKCRADQVLELQPDYQMALSSLPENQLKLREEGEREARTKRWTDELIAYAQEWSTRRDRQARGEQVSEPEPELPAPVPSCRMWTDDEIQAECRRIIEHPTRCDRLEAFAGFVSGQCYLLLEHGQRPGFVVQHAFNTEPAGAVHDAAVPLLTALSAPHLLRRWPPDSLANPKHALLRTLEGHSGGGLNVSVTSDGRRAVSGSSDKTLRVWDLESGQCLRTLEGHSAIVLRVSVTPDGRRAVSGSWDKTLRVWDLESGQCLRTLEGHSAIVLSVSVTPDGRRAVSGSSDKTLRVWDLESGQCLRTLEGHSGGVLSVSVTPDGRRAVSGNEDKTLRVWDLERVGHSAYVRSVSMTPDGQRAVSGSIWPDHTMRVWDLESGQCLRTLEGHCSWNSVSVTPDGQRAVSGGNDNTLRVWDLESGRCLRTLEGHSDWVNSVSVTPDGRHAVSGSRGHTLRVWDLESRRCLRTTEGHSGRVNSVSVTPDGRRAVSVSDDHTPRVWDLRSGQCLRTLEGHSSRVQSIAMTPDGRRAVSGSDDQTLRVWNLENGQCVRTLEGHSAYVSSVRVTPDGRHAVSGTGSFGSHRDHTLRVWDLESGQCLRTLEGHSDWVNSVSVTPNGRRAVSGSQDKTLRVWNLENGQCVRTLEGHSAYVSSVRVTPDGRRAVSGSFDHTLRVWVLESGQCLRTLEGHSEGVSRVNVTPDGRRAVSGSSDHTLRVWDLESGQCLRTLEGHSAYVSSVGVTPDGRRAVSGSSDNTLRVWNLESGQCVSVFSATGPIWRTATGGSEMVVAGTSLGEVLFLELRNVPLGAAILTVQRLQQLTSPDSTHYAARCPVCGTEFAPSANITAAITALSAHLAPTQSPCLDLPAAAFADPRLLSACHHCARTLEFNPFFVELG
ncbi:MAG: AAA family ATPase [Verrucomicrobia bacterium]|nr:AAA family ATPase [Verrucomicrobiota bacterium]